MSDEGLRLSRDFRKENIDEEAKTVGDLLRLLRDMPDDTRVSVLVKSGKREHPGGLCELHYAKRHNSLELVGR